MQPVDDRVRRVVVDRRQQLAAGAGVDQVVDLFLDVHWTSIRTLGNASRYAPKRERTSSGVVEKSPRRS